MTAPPHAWWSPKTNSRNSVSNRSLFSGVGPLPDAIPHRMGIGPVPAVAKLFARPGMSWKDIDLIEVNEAFAAQVLAVRVPGSLTIGATQCQPDPAFPSDIRSGPRVCGS